MSQTERAIYDLDAHTMPLEQVSIEYGGEGLLFRLQQALARLALEEHEQEFVQQSIDLALDLHRDDMRTYEPYYNHLLRVALRLIEDLEVRDPTVISAALLHDSIEDHPDELARRFLDSEIPNDPHIVRNLAARALTEFASEYDAVEMSAMVVAVSNPIVNRGDDKNVSYSRHIRELMLTGSPESVLIKVADFHDNTHAPEGLENPRKRKKLDRKQEPLYEAVEGGLTDIADGVSVEARGAMVHELRKRRDQARRRIEDDPELKSA